MFRNEVKGRAIRFGARYNNENKNFWWYMKSENYIILNNTIWYIFKVKLKRNFVSKWSERQCGKIWCKINNENNNFWWYKSENYIILKDTIWNNIFLKWSLKEALFRNEVKGRVVRFGARYNQLSIWNISTLCLV